MKMLRIRHYASHVLALFVATLVVTGVAPWLDAHDWTRLCSASGVRWADRDGHVVQDGQPVVDGRVVHGHEGHVAHGGGGAPAVDHAAHCPLCLVVIAPPASFAFTAADDAPVARVVAVVLPEPPSARVRAPFPPRAPPLSI